MKASFEMKLHALASRENISAYTYLSNLLASQDCLKLTTHYFISDERCINILVNRYFKRLHRKSHKKMIGHQVVFGSD